MKPNERPTPLTKLIMDNVSIAISADTREQSLAHKEEAQREIEDLERSLAERTEERDKLLEKQSWLIAHPTAIEAAHQVVEWTKCEQERDTALAKLAKCREALELFDLGVGFGVTVEMYDKRKSALEETK